jgi:hypothetical protein
VVFLDTRDPFTEQLGISDLYMEVCSVPVVSQWCHNGVIVVSQWCYCGVTVALWCCYSGVTMVFLDTKDPLTEQLGISDLYMEVRGVTGVLQWCYTHTHTHINAHSQLHTRTRTHTHTHTHTQRHTHTKTHTQVREGGPAARFLQKDLLVFLVGGPLVYIAHIL